MNKTVAAWLPGAIVTGLGIAFTVGGLSYGLTQEGRMAPGLMPTVMGVGVAILGVLLLASDLRSPARTPDGPQSEAVQRVPVTVGASGAPASSDPPVSSDSAGAELADREAKHPLRPWFILAAMVGALLLAPYFGLIPALVLAAFVMMKFVEHDTWTSSICVSLLLLVVSWYIFDEFLEVNLPWGVFEGVV